MDGWMDVNSSKVQGKKINYQEEREIDFSLPLGQQMLHINM